MVYLQKLREYKQKQKTKTAHIIGRSGFFMCKFIKAESAGNDYLYSFEKPWQKSRIIAMCSRRFGAGADGAVFIEKQNGAYYLRIFNADGSEADFCGNACLTAAKLLYDLGLSKRFKFRLQTRAKKAEAEIYNGFSAIKTEGAKLKKTACAEKLLLNELRGTAGIEYADVFTAGNLHLTIKTANLSCLSRKFTNGVIKKIDSCGVFKDGVNIEFFCPSFSGLRGFAAKGECGYGRGVFNGKISDGVNAVVYERGSGYTYSCGSGALAIFACYNLCVRNVFGLSVKYDGGVLTVQRCENGENSDGLRSRFGKSDFCGESACEEDRLKLIGSPKIVYSASALKNEAASGLCGALKKDFIGEDYAD